MPAEDECAKAFETIFYESGKFGSYQRRLYGIVSCIQIVTCSILMYMNFIPPLVRKEKCVNIFTLSNETVVFMNVNETATFGVECTTVFENEMNLGQHWVLPKWSYPDYGDHQQVRYIIYYAQMAGLLLGLIVGSFLSDYFGRRRVMFAAYSAMCFFQSCTAISESWEGFFVTQLLVGIFAGCVLLTSQVLMIEYLCHDWRDICICLAPWWLGPSLLSLEAWIIGHWRYLALVTGAIGLPLVGTYFLVLESCRWMMCNHKFAEAEQTTKELVSCNCSAVEQITQLFDMARASVLTTMHKRKYTFFNVVQSCDLRKWTLSVIFTWLFGCMVYCGLHRRVTSITGNPYFNNVILYITEVIVIFSAIFINKCIGRRWCVFLYAMSSGFISICIIVLHVTNESDIDESMITALAFFTKLGVTTSITLINIITLEVYPTVIRTMGLSVGFCSGLIGFLLSDKLIIYLEAFHYTIPFIVYGGMMVLFAIVALFLPETVHQPLPDILRCRHRNLCSHETIQLVSNFDADSSTYVCPPQYKLAKKYLKDTQRQNRHFVPSDRKSYYQSFKLQDKERPI